jgi:hypothetical protein
LCRFDEMEAPQEEHGHRLRRRTRGFPVISATAAGTGWTAGVGLNYKFGWLISQRRKLVAALFRITLIIVGLAVMTSQALSQGKPTRFWNLTRNTISEFYLAPAGTTNWGPNQCKNDKDGAVDTDERLRITDVSSGSYDAKLVDTTGRTCIVRNVKVQAGGIFTIDEKDLTSCTH